MIRAVWTAALSRSTCSLVDATSASVPPWWWLSPRRSAIQVEMLVEGAGDDPAVRLVGVQARGVTDAQLQRRFGFPAVGEPVDVFERWTRPLQQSSSNRPPRPTACNWRGSPTSTSRHSFCRASVTSRCRSAVASIPASSTTTVVCAGSCQNHSGGRSGRDHSWSSLATVSASIPVSRSSTRAALAVGASPNTGRGVSVQVLAGGGEHSGLARPRRPDHQHQRSCPATAAAALGLQHVQPLDVQRRRRVRGRRIGRRSPRRRSPLPRPAPPRWSTPVRSVRSTPTAHPTPPASVLCDGSRSTHCSTTRSAARSNTSSQRWAGIWASGVARRRSPAARRPGTTSTPSSPRLDDLVHGPLGHGPIRLCPAGGGDRVGEQLARSSRRLRPRSATVSPDPVHRCRTSSVGCPWRPPVASPPARTASVSRPSRSLNSATFTARAASISTLRFENARSSSRGTPAISACPLTIRRHPTPNRAVSSERSSDWYKPPNIR